jgi:hypothetical protein
VDKFLKIFSILLAITVAVFLFFAWTSDSAKLQEKAQESIKIQEQMDAEAKLQSEKEAQEQNRLEKLASSLPRIICWGDSLTARADAKDGISYPQALADIIKLDVKNYGAWDETTEQIAYRQGGKKLFTSAFVIPSTPSQVTMSLVNENDENVSLFGQGSSSINPCTIGGIKGEISLDQGSNTYNFKRQEAGNEQSIPAKTQVFTNAMSDRKTDDIVIIFSGTNDKPNNITIRNVIDIQKAMLAYSGSEKYIVIGLTSKLMIPEIDKVNSALQIEYNLKFFDFRKYLLEKGLTDAGINPIDQDKTDILKGEIPTSLRADTVLGNSYFIHLLAKQVYQKIIDLGYLTQDQIDYLGLNKK